MKFTFSYKDQWTDLEMPINITVSRMKEELQRIFKIEGHIELELTNKHKFLEDQYKLSDYQMNQGDYITLLEDING